MFELINSHAKFEQQYIYYLNYRMHELCMGSYIPNYLSIEFGHLKEKKTAFFFESEPWIYTVFTCSLQSLKRYKYTLCVL
jgi:hypothetical protein